ncbi:adenine nucleotide alpha hydrolase family protein [Ferruginibacter sp.]
MKKILIALDGEHFPHGALRFAEFINKQEEILLAGVFLSPVDYSKLMAYTAGVDGVGVMPDWPAKSDDAELIAANIHLFEEACNERGINYRIHKDDDLTALSSLVKETRFADLLLVSSELFYKNVSAEQPNYYLEEVLKDAECPVMLLPENFVPSTTVLMCYDSGASSLFAIRQFAYLFPNLAGKRSVLVCINDTKTEDLPEYEMLSELLEGHYPYLQIHNIREADKKHFAEWLAGQPNSYVVMGAFSRGMLSEIFRKSFAKDVIRDIRMPLFISHK